jgi:antitoxin YefM
MRERKSMQSIYRLKADELNEDFLEGLKRIFKDKEIEIVVSEVDETEYLLQSLANRERLLNALNNVENQENLVEVNLE